MIKKIKSEKGNEMEKKKGVFRVEKDKEFPLFLDHEWYPAKFSKHEVGSGEYGDWIKLTFTVLGKTMESGDPAKGRTATALMNAELSPSSKLFEFVKVLAGEEFDLGEKVDITAYYGKKVMVFIEDKKPKKGGGDGKRYQHITKLRERKEKAE